MTTTPQEPVTEIDIIKATEAMERVREQIKTYDFVTPHDKPEERYTEYDRYICGLRALLPLMEKTLIRADSRPVQPPRDELIEKHDYKEVGFNAGEMRANITRPRIDWWWLEHRISRQRDEIARLREFTAAPAIDSDSFNKFKATLDNPPPPTPELIELMSDAPTDGEYKGDPSDPVLNETGFIKLAEFIYPKITEDMPASAGWPKDNKPAEKPLSIKHADSTSFEEFETDGEMEAALKALESIEYYEPDNSESFDEAGWDINDCASFVTKHFDTLKRALTKKSRG